MMQILHDEYFLKSQKLFCMFCCLLFCSLAYTQPINVTVDRVNIQFFSDPTQGGGFGQNGSDDCFNGPDLKVFNRLYINGVNYDNNYSYPNHAPRVNPWWNPEYPDYYHWYTGTNIPSNSTIAIQQNAYEDDAGDNICGSNDADCGGYQTLLSASNIIDRFSPCGDYFADSQWCTGGNDDRFWGLSAIVTWNWVYLNPGTIETQKFVCPGVGGVWIKSTDFGTTKGTYSNWEYSTNGVTYNAFWSFPEDSAYFTLPGGYTVGSTYYIRRKKQSSCSVFGQPFVPTPPDVYSNICTVKVIAAPTTPATATPSQTSPDCGSFTLSNPVDPLNNMVPFTWEYQTSVNGGSVWSSSQSTTPTIFANTGINNRTACIRLRPNYDNGCGAAPWQSYCFTQKANPKGPTIDSVYPDPSIPYICNGDGGVWATFNSGTGGGHDVFEYSTNGTTWQVYTAGQVIPIPINKDIEIRGRRIGSGSCISTAWTSLALWPRNTIIKEAAVISPKLNVKTPNTATVCRGTNVSATIIAGSGGAIRPNDERQYSIDGGLTWSDYTSGLTVLTTDAVDSVLIRVRRNDGTNPIKPYRGICSTDWTVISKWIIIDNPVPIISAISSSSCYNPNNPYADFSAIDPAPGIGTWSILSGSGSLSSTAALITTITGLTAAAATQVRWSVTKAGCTAVKDTIITPITTSLLNLTNGGLCQICPVYNGISYRYYDNVGKLMAKIDDLAVPSAALQNTEVCVGIDASVQKVLTTFGDLQPYLQRHFTIKPVTNTNSTITFYFTATEFNNLKTTCNATRFAFTNVNQLIVSKFPGGGSNIYTLPNTSGGEYILPTTSGLDANGYYFITIPVSTFSTFYIHSNGGLNSVLPVELMSFTGSMHKDEIELQWKTTSEVNVLKYEIEKSEDGITWQYLTYKDALNATGVNLYSAIDYYPKIGVNLYRLKTIEKDAAIHYSEIIKVENQEFRSQIYIYPNPVSNKLIAVINSDKEYEMTIKLFSALGTEIIQSSSFIKIGSNEIDFSFNDLPKGIYTIQFYDLSNLILSKKIIKE